MLFSPHSRRCSTKRAGNFPLGGSGLLALWDHCSYCGRCGCIHSVWLGPGKSSGTEYYARRSVKSFDLLQSLKTFPSLYQ